MLSLSKHDGRWCGVAITPVGTHAKGEAGRDLEADRPHCYNRGHGQREG